MLILILGAWPGGRAAQAAPSGAVAAWGAHDTVPAAVLSEVTAIAAGYRHNLALKSDGTVVAWGSNEYGQSTVPGNLSGVTAIAAGWFHSLALKSDGTVVAWGWNGSGQSTVPGNLSGVIAITGGLRHSLALKSDGTVVAWGWNIARQSTVPGNLRGVIAIAAGSVHSLALKSDGSVVAWGDQGYNQSIVPENLSGVIAIAAGQFHNVALKSDGTLVAWGDNDYDQSTVPENLSGVTAIAAGLRHNLALKSDGTVVAWGDNGYDQSTVPENLSGVTAIAAGADHSAALVIPTAPIIRSQPLGQTVELGSRANFTVLATGYPFNNYQWRKEGIDISGATNASYDFQITQTNQAGGYTVVVSNFLGSVTSAPPAALIVTAFPPTIITPPVSQTVQEWQRASFFVAATGSVLTYQWRKDGVDLTGATNAAYDFALTQTNQTGSYTVVVSNVLGSVTSAPPAVLTVNPPAPGSVMAWGWDFIYTEYAGVGRTIYTGQATVPVSAVSGITAIAAGGSHTVALKIDGTVVAWGNNTSGQVTGTSTNDGFFSSAIASPVILGGQVLSGVTAIAAGDSHTVALKNDGSVVAWGWNRRGEVTGTPTTDPSAIASPVRLGGEVLSGVAAIAAGHSHSVALKNDGSVVAWGDNGSGQVTGIPTIGDFPYSATARPVTLGAKVLSGVKAIAAGANHTVALKIDGSVVVWGAGASATASPVTLGGQVLSGVAAIAAGDYHTVALKNDGSVVAWGWNGSGQVTGTPPDNFNDDDAIASPVTLEGEALSSVTAIAAGHSHTVALKNDGSVVAWGAKIFGSTTLPMPLSGVTAIAAGTYHTVALLGAVLPLPSLNARPSGDGLILAWPTNAFGFRLQSTLTLTPPVTWIDSTNSTAIVGAQFTVTNVGSGGARFYRLRKL